ncbi:hypothetical protein PTTG_25865 [Puccinia triticina 1-1 BBBD Race 1]|uniref:Uncharacterized protein n=2 Tax=Puccinia triticina TaxID=208348 RepID=A0A180H0N6_PUCT1|nr:uncharacterized protein PtA15_15A410 [Puccinia triticina]OAV97893.1 hypothetical protein PTTG_25865 [Puccinia triticina 1-1 BBBD Race 1]WAQ92016.1 hypothetical protein PtA15_15A410 [Puccinia triticina]
MTKDCQCHRLFYPTLIRSCCSSNYVHSLKTKTTISPVITTLRTIGVMQRKKRKNEDLLLRSKLSKPCCSTNEMDSHPGPTGKRTFPQNFEYDYHHFKQRLSLSSEPQSFHLVSNRFLVGLDYDASRPKTGKFVKRIITDQTELSQVFSNSNTLNNIPSGYSRTNKRYGKSVYHSCDSVGKENCGGSREQPYSVNNSREVRSISTEQDSPFNLVASPKIDITEDQFIFTMSPFSSTQTLSTFMRSPANPAESYKLVKSFDHKKLKSRDLVEENDEDQDERSISITSVLPIDIPQSHKST